MESNTNSNSNSNCYSSQFNYNNLMETSEQALAHKLIIEIDRNVLIYYGKGLRFECRCGTDFSSAPILLKHIEQCKNCSFKSLDAFRCHKCLKIFENLKKTAAHYSRCNGRVVEADGLSSDLTNMEQVDCFKCRFCNRNFKTKIGAGQHESKTHPSERSCVDPRATKPVWSLAEYDLLVEAEAIVSIELRGSNSTQSMNQLVLDAMLHIDPQFARTRDAIAGKRRTTAGHGDAILNRINEIDFKHCSSQFDQNNLTLQQPQDTQVSARSCDVSSDCECLHSVQNEIDGHLNRIEGEIKYEKCLILLRQINEDLSAYSTERFVEAFMKQRILTAKDNVPRTLEKVGKRAARRRHESGRVRSILEEQGPKRCMQYLRNPTDQVLCPKETAQVFKQVFENEEDIEDDAPFEAKNSHRPHSIHAAITANEVAKHLRSFSAKTAPGPDGIKIEALKGVCFANLACLLNLFLKHKNVPSVLKQNKTTMIPKKLNPGVSDWRPISVASVIDRLFAKILEARLCTAIDLSSRQRGFIRALDGCGENITAYGGALKYARLRGKPCVVTSLDLAKAFDSVRYSSIERSLKRLSVDVLSIKLLMNLCEGQVTTIKHCEGTDQVTLKQGVRQGWPLSPLLFLCVVDELLSSLESKNGFHIENMVGEVATMTGLAFADDLILYSDSPTGMRALVRTSEQWCRARGLEINPQKSSVLYLERVPKKKRVRISKTRIEIDGVAIPNVEDNFERVLGVHLHHTGKRDHQKDIFSKDLELVAKSALRPTQKLLMIRECLLPSIKFRLVHGFASVGTCKQIDKIVRRTIRQILHLPKYYLNDLMYLSTSSGGLGVTELTTQVPIEQLALQMRMSRSNNQVTRLIAGMRSNEYLLRIARKGAGTSDTSIDSIDTLKEYFKSCRRQKVSVKCQGEGWSLFNKAPNKCLCTPRERGWTETDVIDAIKLRSGNLMTRALTARTVGRGSNIDTSCRGCKGATETQAHLLSKCPSTQPGRVSRHDAICAYVAMALRRASMKSATNISVEREVGIRIQNGESDSLSAGTLLKPDILVRTDNCTVLIEVSVVYELDNKQLNSLECIRQRKLRKYQPLIQVLKERYGKKVQINTLIVGCRGGWISSNNKAFRGTGVEMSEHDKNCLVERAVRGSLITYRRFIASHFEPLRKYISRQG